MDGNAKQGRAERILLIVSGEIEPMERCCGHKVEVRKLDLSKSYGTDVPHYQVRCAVPPNYCYFGDYFPSRATAIKDWNDATIEHELFKENQDAK